MKLSILIPQLPNRDSTLLVHNLHTQSKNLPVEILCLSDESNSGIKRNILTSEARGEYICFIDDDDRVDKNYVSELIAATKDSPDLITFNLEMTNGHKRETWKFCGAYDDRRLGLMLPNHLCVWRKSIASRVPWSPGLGTADDILWYETIHALTKKMGTLSTIHLNKTLYYYEYSHSTTVNQSNRKIQEAKEYFGRKLRSYLHGDRVVIDHGYNRLSDSVISVFTTTGIEQLPRKELTTLCTVAPWFTRNRR